LAAKLKVRLFDGARQPLAPSQDALISIFAGGRQLFRDYRPTPEIDFSFDKPVSLRVLVHVKHFRDSGFAPVPLAKDSESTLDLMLLARGGSFNFADARWPKLKPEWRAFLGPRADYEDRLESRPIALATMLNVLAASEALGVLPHFRSVEWSTLRNDRFFCWVDKALVDFVASSSKRFQRSSAVSHPGATRTFKQTDFNEANLQYSLHENAEPPAGLEGAVRVECDMDYYKDKGAHFLLEVLPNRLTGSKTNPALVYMLRWMAGRRAGDADFAPPYVFL
jgi:hypothetical protein